jgi:serine/threonine-protein kinase
VAIFDVGECDGTPFLAMEFINGKTLRAYVGDRALSMERRARWLIDIARALGAAHKRGLVHRDVKPENVMVREDGVVKVLDFGIARRSSVPVDPTAPTEAVALETLTAKGIVVGTPVYMAPEQMRGEALDGRADQFAWGVLAYELLTGTLPWTATGPALQIVSQILSKEPEPPSGRNPAIPADVERAVMRALSKSAKDRFDAMEQILPLLEPHAGISAQIAAPLPSVRPPQKSTHPSGSQKTQLTNSQTPPTLPSARAPAWRNRALAGLAVIVVVGAIAAVVLRRGKTTVTPPVPSPTPVTQTLLAWTDSGSAMSANAEALGAYHAGCKGCATLRWIARGTISSGRRTSTRPSPRRTCARRSWRRRSIRRRGRTSKKRFSFVSRSPSAIAHCSTPSSRGCTCRPICASRSAACKRPSPRAPTTPISTRCSGPCAI